MSDLEYEPAVEARVCDIADCVRPAWGSEAQCRPHLLRGVTPEKIAARQEMLDAAKAVAEGETPAKQSLIDLAIELGVTVKSSWSIEKIQAAIDAVRTSTSDPVAVLADEDPSAFDSAAMQAAQVTGVPDSDSVANTKENTDG